ncbi:intermembrane transport protein PqiB [Sulfurovum riftiae]|uniref:Mammalian cell entry protein n=1 Tax=Sulfurovum riftiae TaxID=1630136 RepID=A0A151CJI1_9BACT|nr:MlaD family protein [Sulfurovum riftiae]KYJ87685.1 mammalian cell entry protein [Sulfurovum riftiae]
MQNSNDDLSNVEIEEAVWRKKRKSISTVWIVPIVALIVGAWLIIQSINEKGPVIHITFKSAEGVQADKTVIKYKDIVVGKVTDVAFSEDLSNVIVTAEMKKNMRSYLSEKSRFWVMKARIGLNQVEGLDTLLSGVYIVMDPEKGKESVREFKGLDTMPVISTDEKGTRYTLKAQDIGSIGVGSPIYYKKLPAGSVSAYRLSPDGKNIDIEIFIKAPYDRLITDHTRFWNASGISATFTADGMDIRTESLTSIIAGGLAFDNFHQTETVKKVKENHQFILYNSIKDAKKMHYKRELFFWVYFGSSIRGLSVGAPVEFRGVKIGEVVNFSLIGNADDAKFEIPILIKVEPERFMIFPQDVNHSAEPNAKVLKKLIENGFRAQLKSGNLITGELFVDLDMHKDVPPESLKKENGLYLIPTVPGTIETLKSDLKTVLDRIAAVPFEEIGKELQMTLKDLRTGTIPKLDATIQSTDNMMKGAGSSMQALQKNYLDSNAQINKKIIKLLEEMTRTSRSVKNLTDYLERHPESLIKGK